jgi:hypothetical protein
MTSKRVALYVPLHVRWQRGPLRLEPRMESAKRQGVDAPDRLSARARGQQFSWPVRTWLYDWRDQLTAAYMATRRRVVRSIDHRFPASTVLQHKNFVSAIIVLFVCQLMADPTEQCGALAFQSLQQAAAPSTALHAALGPGSRRQDWPWCAR